MVHDPVALLGFLGSVFVSKVMAWKDLGGALDDDVAMFTRDDEPLKGLVSSGQSSSSESNVLPPARGRVCHCKENGDTLLSMAS